ncbi:ABC transporter substrate-binding protein [Tomitella gaofuii]|uniref:ABC transporter substrate-binding protein n=1 Tax=Tomitella gaofuii TaxID=2760083 RepID=UPI0015FDED87|nr:ABC transporter substrate-binding protein [Tomitella gaofuii]
MKFPQRARPARLAAAAAAAILSTAVLTACSTASDASESGSTITVAEQSVAGMTTGLWPHLADALGYFDDEGIAVDKYVKVTKGADAINGMQSGAVQISHIGVDGIAAASKGANVVGISAAMDASIWTVLASPGIDSWDELRGKTIALGSTNDITRVIFDNLAEQAGLDPENDLTYVALGATPQRVAAVENGQAAATLSTYPTAYTAINSGGLTDLGFAPSGGQTPRLMTTDIEASGKWAKANPEAVTKYLRAIIKAVEFVKDPANEDKAVTEIGKLVDDPPEAIKAGLEKYFYAPAIPNAYFPDDFHHDPGVFTATVDAYLELGLMDKPITEEQYMDYSYLDAARGEK